MHLRPFRLSGCRTARPNGAQSRPQGISPARRGARVPTRRRRYLFGGTPPTVPAAALLRETCARSDVCCKLAHYLVYLPARGVREPERVVLSSTSPNTTSAQLCCLQVGNCRLGLPCLNAFRRAAACLHVRTCRHPQYAPQYKQVQASSSKCKQVHASSSNRPCNAASRHKGACFPAPPRAPKAPARGSNQTAGFF